MVTVETKKNVDVGGYASADGGSNRKRDGGETVGSGSGSWQMARLII